MADCCLFLISEIPEDPLVAEEYYADVFDSCSEESEEQEEEVAFLGPEEEDKDEGPCLPHRTNQQVILLPAKSCGTDGCSDWTLPEDLKEVLKPKAEDRNTRDFIMALCNKS
jgi:hypothetical protein